MTRPDRRPAVATVLEPSERARLDAAAQGHFATVHAETIRDAIRAVRERPVHAILVSPRCVTREQLPGVALLVKAFPAVPTVAVLSRHDALASERLLTLGATGVHRVLDLTGRDGWRRLREMLAEPVSPTAVRMLAAIVPALDEPTPACREFFDVLVRQGPQIRSVRALCTTFGLRPSTFVSRFVRWGLPSPKRYLSTSRVVHAAALFESRGLSVGDVAYRLDYSSPQSFSRHLRAAIGVPASEFRRRYSFDRTLMDFVSRLITPFRATFRRFHPLIPGVADTGHRSWTASWKGVQDG